MKAGLRIFSVQIWHFAVVDIQKSKNILFNPSFVKNLRSEGNECFSQNVRRLSLYKRFFDQIPLLTEVRSGVLYIRAL